MATFTGSQIRMARACLHWSVHDLADASGVAISAIRRMEDNDGVLKARGYNLDSVRLTFERRGVTFLDSDLSGPGIRWQAPPR